MNLKTKDIRNEIIDVKCGFRTTREMLHGEIPGASVFHHALPSRETIFFEGQSSFIRVFFLCNGAVDFESGDIKYMAIDKAVYSDVPYNSVSVTAQADSSFLEIRWDMFDEDLAEISANLERFPIRKAYKDAMQYRDSFKSEVPISRAIIPQQNIPRFAFGSVESHGEDLIGQHEHPLLDQFFFSFPENDMSVLVDSCIFHMKGNTLLHIPLGSSHGVVSFENQCAHYLWIDFTPKDKKQQAIDYLNVTHKPL